mmetsp:Transcript_4998/g.9948  ORF Transcript_4998/g.9948 Transcript_4998/m.9948 type:complete len:211 (-) Transcript_4998:1391-2023(-)
MLSINRKREIGCRIKKKKYRVFRIFEIKFYSFKNVQILKSKNSHPALKLEYNFFNQTIKQKFLCIVILLKVNNAPHLLLLREKKIKLKFALPGGSFKRDETEISALKRLVSQKISRKTETRIDSFHKIGKWIFPNNDSRVKYAFFPPHLKFQQKELSIFLIELSKIKDFEVDEKWDLLAIPLFEIYDKAGKYGSIISKIPNSITSYLVNL